MENLTVEKVKDFWESWEIRVSILASLSIQAVLTIVAPFRKSSASSFLRLLIWILYLSADSIAVFVLGLIASNEADSPEKKEILAFWAPFLLLHLGGPDTITALALEDNELWHRHVLQLLTQLAITIYVFIISFRHKGLLAPTLFMLCDGLWKYFERTCALYYASADNFRESLVGKPEAGPNYARLMEEYVSAKDAHIPVEFQGKDGVLLAGKATDGSNNNEDVSKVDDDFGKGAKAEEKSVIKAHEFYELFKSLLADGFLSLKNRNESRKFFVHSKNGFEIVEIELNLIYDIFYTKSYLLQKKRAFARLGCFFVAIVSLILFCFKDRSKYSKYDVIITFVLLGGAITLDICGALMFVASDWFIIICHNLDGIFGCFKSIMKGVLECKEWARRCHYCQNGEEESNRQRWSGSISQYNLVRRCFRKPPFFFKSFSKIKKIKDMLLGFLYVEKETTGVQCIIDYIIEELQYKAVQAAETEVAKDVCSARGSLCLVDDYFLASECLSPWTTEMDFDESLLTWHLATDLCYLTSMKETSTDSTVNNSAADNLAKNRKISKALSNYMSYLLLRQETMLSSLVGMSESRFEDTCEEAKKFMNYKTTKFSWLNWFMLKIFCCECVERTLDESLEEEDKNFKDFREAVLKINADVAPITAKGDKSKSVLFDACRLAKQLEMFGEHQWEIIAKVWVELLCYAAVRCSPRSHIAQLNKGGELITLVWLYMAHLGLGERFLQNQGFGWTKLIVDK